MPTRHKNPESPPSFGSPGIDFGRVSAADVPAILRAYTFLIDSECQKVCARYSRPDLAPDAAQLVRKVFWRRVRAGGVWIGHERGFLARLAMRICARLVRQERKRAAIEVPTSPVDSSSALGGSHEDTIVERELEGIRSEWAAAAFRALGEIPRAQAHVLQGRVAEPPKSYEALAGELGIRPSTARSHYRRGVIQLRRLLAPFLVRPRD